MPHRQECPTNDECPSNDEEKAVSVFSFVIGGAFVIRNLNNLTE
jgi:hypothetical protein